MALYQLPAAIESQISVLPFEFAIEMPQSGLFLPTSPFDRAVVSIVYSGLLNPR
jgi:hypothetical protein